MSLFHNSQHWTDTYVTGGFSPHIRFGGFLLINNPSQMKHNNITGIFYDYEFYIIMPLSTALCWGWYSFFLRTEANGQ
jgi:hypothetical protein